MRGEEKLRERVGDGRMDGKLCAALCDIDRDYNPFSRPLSLADAFFISVNLCQAVNFH